MHAVKEGARLRCPSSWVQLGIRDGSLLLYFQYSAMTKRKNPNAIDQSKVNWADFSDNFQNDVPSSNSSKVSVRDFKSSC